MRLSMLMCAQNVHVSVALAVAYGIGTSTLGEDYA